MKKFSFVILTMLIMLMTAPIASTQENPGEPSENGIQPIWEDGNPKCEDLSYCNCTLNFKPQPEPPTSGTYPYPSDPGESVTINSDGTYFSWTSTLPVCCVIVKGGPNANVYVYSPTSYGDANLHCPINPNNDKLYDISHIDFCYSEDGGVEDPFDVEVEVDTDYTRTWNWTIDKTVNPDVWHLFRGDQGTSKYSVIVDKTDFTDSGWQVSGTIYINNGGPYEPQIESVSLMINGTPVTPSCDNTLPYVISVGETMECTFSAFLPDGSDRTALVSVITSNPDGLSTGSADIVFGEPTSTTNETIDVDDTNGYSWSFRDDGAVTYTETFTCMDDGGEHTNVATIRGTAQSASATVNVYCHELEIKKDAGTSYKRQYGWTIDKSAEKTVLALKGCTEEGVCYKVVVDATFIDTDFKVEGKIYLHNPAPMTAKINSLEDVLPDAVNLVVDCGVTFPYDLPGDGTLECSYSADLPDAVQRLNSATAKLQNHSYYQEPTSGQIMGDPTTVTEFTATVDVIFSEPANEIDECAMVYDTNLDPTLLGEVCVADLPKTFEYCLTVGPYYASNFYYIENTAWFVTNDTPLKGSDSWKLTIDVKCEPAIADFTAEPNSGTSPLTVQFKSLSTNAAKWLWDFGDGCTSTEENPVHTYYNPPRKHYNVTLTVWDCCNEFEDSMTRIDFVKVMISADVEFSAYPIVGPPELEVQFVNRSGGVATHWLWIYGDGQVDNFMHDVRFGIDPVHKYQKEGMYTASLEGWGPGGSDKMIASNLVYVDSYYVALEFVDGGETLPGESWEDAIDHDVMSTDASVSAIDGDAWATFRFADENTKMIHKVRLLANNIFGTAYVNQLARDFELWVSLDGVNFTPGFVNTLDSKFGWHEFAFDPIEAKFVKLVLLNARGAHSQYVTLHEFQLFGETKVEGKAKFLVTIKDESSNIVAVPTEYGLGQNYPNPFNPETMIQFQLPEAAAVQLAIYNIRGQLIVSLVDERKAAGYHQVAWKGIDAAGTPVGSGIYLYSIRATNDQSAVFLIIRKMTMIK